MKKITIRPDGSRRVQLIIEEPTKTQQHMKDECDVNKILEKYRKTGMISHVSHSSGSVGDFSQYQDFKTNLDTISIAMQSFMDLPSNVRKRFGNDPSNLIEFVQNSENYDEALKLGLVQAKVVQQQAAQNDDQTTNNSATQQTTT